MTGLTSGMMSLRGQRSETLRRLQETPGDQHCPATQPQTCLTLTLAQPRTGLISIKIRFTITWVTPDNKTSHKCPQCHAQSDLSSLNNGFDFSVAIMISISASWSTLTPGDINAKLYMELLALRIRDSAGKTIVIKFVTSRAWLWSKWRNRCWWPVRSRDNFDNSGV